MNENEAIERIKTGVCCEKGTARCCTDACMYGKEKCAYSVAIKALEEIQQYRAIGTPEELQKAEKEENILKFYYCDSEDSYLIGLRVGNFYYAHYLDGSWVFDMSRYLPWGEHVKQESAAWKEYTYPSEPREINFSEWFKGFIKRECGGTPEECRAAVEKQTAKKVKSISKVKDGDSYVGLIGRCPCCGDILEEGTVWCDCGQKLDWNTDTVADQ